jgi:hypothetical protein
MGGALRTVAAWTIAAAAVGATGGHAVAEQSGVAHASATPILAGPWSPNQQGYGHARPLTIFNGGDPTGLVKHIEWLVWGGPRAVGVGVGFYVAPNQHTFEGHPEAAVVVLFRLRRCHGRPAYNAIEWYSPQHGDHFDPQEYINACTGQYLERR